MIRVFRNPVILSALSTLICGMPAQGSIISPQCGVLLTGERQAAHRENPEHSELPKWLTDSIRADQDVPLQKFGSLSASRYLKPSVSSEGLRTKLASDFENQLMFRGQRLKTELTREQVRDMFFHPNTILSSKQLRIQNLQQVQSPVGLFHRVERWTPETLTRLYQQVPREFNETVSDLAALHRAMSDHSGASSNPGSGFVSPFVSFSTDAVIAGQFRKGLENTEFSILITVRRPKFGAVDTDAFNEIDLPKVVNGKPFVDIDVSPTLNEREVLVYGIVEPESILSIDYKNHMTGKTILAVRDKRNPLEIQIVEY